MKKFIGCLTASLFVPALVFGSAASVAHAVTAQDKCLAIKVGATGSVTPPSVGVTPEHYTDGCA